MKAECLLLTKDGGVFSVIGKLEEGKKYLIEDAETGTAAQRATREALIDEYYECGVHPKYGGESPSVFRDSLKRDIGAGFEIHHYCYIIDGKIKRGKSKYYEDIPEDVRINQRDSIFGILKSCRDYTKKENQSFIDKLISSMIANGVNSNKFQEIMKELDK